MQLHHLRDGKQPDHGDGKRDAVQQMQDAEGVARRRGDRIHADEGDEDAEGGRHQALEQRAGAEGGDERHAPERHHQVFGRSQGQNDRPHERNAGRQEDGADDPAQQDRHGRRAERPLALASHGHGIAVEHQGQAFGGARHVEQDAGDGIAPEGGDMGAEQKRQRGGDFVTVGEGQEQRHGDDAAKARQDADHQAVQDADQHEEKRLRREQGQQP